MEQIGNGLGKGSYMYFYTAGQTAKRLLYYPTAAGEFFCSGDYKVVRDSYDSILALFVADGELTLFQDGLSVTARKSEMLLVNCYEPHRYFTESFAHTFWVHFDGANSLEWYREIKAQKGVRIKCRPDMAERISDILRCIKDGKSEYDISNGLYSMLCDLGKGAEKEAQGEKEDCVDRAKKYIAANYDKNISVEEIARSANMSVSYFSKVFRESTGFSPYDYLLSVRLDRAKELLHKTDCSIQETAFKTGFNSASNFICFFKKEAGITPLKFRKLKF